MEDFLWLGPIGEPGGYGAVARNYIRGLAEIGARVVPSPVGGRAPVLEPRDEVLMASLPNEPTGHETAVVHVDPRSFDIAEEARRVTDGPVVGCTIAETDRIPDDWVEACNQLDEIWVPSEFNWLTFARSGVDQSRLRVVPYGLDMGGWPTDGPRLEAIPAERFCFVYCFGYDWRKGFDILLAAYLSEFTAADPVSLVLKVFDPPNGPARRPLRERLEDAVRPLGASLETPGGPQVLILDQHVERTGLAALFRRADLYVSTERANGWAYPCMEVAALGRPAAGLDWGGSTEWMHSGNALLIPPGPLVPVDARLSAERPEFAGQRWPEMRVEDVRALMREAASGAHDLEALGARAEAEVRERWSAVRAAEAIVERNSEKAYRSPAGLRERLRPQLGLAPETPLAGARERVLVAAFDRAGAWRAAFDAHLDAFKEDDPVTLCLLAPPGSDPDSFEGAVVEHLARRGADPDRIPDTIITVADPEEALVAPGVRALVEPAALWPHNRRRVKPTVDALREAA